MIKRLSLFYIFFLFTAKFSTAQEAQTSLMDDISYVYIEKLIAIAKENYPRVKTNNSHIAVAQSAVTNAKISWLSPLSLSYVYSPANTLNITNPTFFSGYQIGFSLSLNSFLQVPVNIKRSKEELKIANYDSQEYLLSLTTEVKTRYFNYLQAVKSLKLNTQTNSDSQHSLSLLKHRFEKGEATFAEYNMAVTSFTTSTQAKIASEAALLIAKAALEELLGIRLEEIPN